MKNLVALLFFVALFATSYGQNNQKQLDIMIMVDNDLSGGSISNVAFKLLLKNDSSITIDVNYYPGNLSINQADFDLIINEQVKDVKLLCSYFKYNGEQRFSRDYILDIKKWWLKDTYNVIRIYNVDRGPYKRVFSPLHKDKPYTFELNSPSNGFNRVKKKQID